MFVILKQILAELISLTENKTNTRDIATTRIEYGAEKIAEKFSSKIGLMESNLVSSHLSEAKG